MNYAKRCTGRSINLNTRIEMSELYIPPERPTRNLVNGRFLKGHTPFNKGRKWSDYLDSRKKRKMLKNLSLGRKGNPSIAGNNARPIVAIKDRRLIAVFPSSNAAERKTGICSRNIRSCCSGKRKHAGGYEWFFESDNQWLNIVNE
ncbi:hypothetical protein [Bacteroides sp. AF39-11AC]|uniref:hypothetical protein n=2 Tax=Bacteroides TaxID=816 RepID=UPI001F214744|nr:hypothetical protein [Bacteroides sp. AF39-11AC]